MLRILLLIAGLFAFATFSHADEPITLTLWELSVNEQLMRGLLNKFEKENPHIRVRLQQLTWEYGLDKFIISLAAGNAPDICELGTTWVSKFASKGVLLDLTDDIRDIQEKYFLWEPTAYRGRFYGLPWLAGTRVLFYNRGLFKKASLDPEAGLRTPEGLLDAAKTLHSPENGVWGFSIFAGEPESPWQEFLPFAWSAGAQILSSDLKDCLLDSKEMIGALEFYKELSRYSLIERQAQVNELFAQGQVAMQISGSWNLRLIPRQNPALDFAVRPVPGVAFSGGEILVITKTSRHPKEALKLIKFLTNKENVMEVVRVQQNVVPAQKEALEDPYYEQYPEQKVFLTQLKNASGPPGHPKWTEIQGHITTMIEEVVMKGVAPQEAAKKASSALGDILREEGAAGAAAGATLNIGLILAILAAAVLIYIILKKNPINFLYLSPWLVTFLFFGLYPLIYSIIISLSRYDVLTSQFSLVGLKNYISAIYDRDFQRALWHTIVFCIGTVPFTVALSLFCAVLINRKIPFKQFYQAGLFLPVTTSVVVIATVFTYIYSPNGLANRTLDYLGIIHPQSSWLNSPKAWFDIGLPLLSIMAMNIWASFGYYTVLFLAGLQTIPDGLYEVASLDGATEWQKFRYITFPQLKPIILLVVVINTIYSLQVFPEIFTMTMGGPLGATTTAVYHIYELGFHRFDMGKASSAAYILSIIILLFSVLQMKLLRTDEELKE